MDAFSYPAEQQIVSIREVDAVRERVFRAWSLPEHLATWWGPAGFTNTFDSFDFRVGGRWKFTMHGPDKGHYRNEVEFLGIDPPESIYWKRITPPFFHIRVTFDALPQGRTRVTFRMLFDDAKERDKLARYVIGKNEENLDRLEAALLHVR